MKKKTINKKDIRFIYACFGSLNLIRERRSKSIFYSYDKENDLWILIDNVVYNKELTFKTKEELDKYIEEYYN